MPEAQVRADLIDVIIQTLTHGVMKHINRVLEAYDFEGDELLHLEEDEEGNPINIGNWDFRPMSTDRTLETVPHILIGRVLDWAEDNVGMSVPGFDYQQYKEKEEETDALVISETTGAQPDGTLLVDGLVNFEQQGVSHNQWVGLFDDSGDLQDSSFVQKIISPHKIRLQDELFFKTAGGENYEIHHARVRRMFHTTGTVIVRFVSHTGTMQKATLVGHAMRRYFETIMADDDLIEVELKKRNEGELPAWAFVEEVGRTLNTSDLLTDNEKTRGIQHRRELQVSLKATENLHRLDPASEIQFGVKMKT